MKHYVFKAKAETAELMIYGEIGADPWADQTMEARDVIDALADAGAVPVSVRINSPGGIVADALAIYNALKRHPAPVSVDIDGQAYSAASLIAMAGEPLRMADNALMMIHGPSTIAAGKAGEMRQAAEALDRVSEAMAQVYAARAGVTPATARDWLTDGLDHYFTAAEAEQAGLVDDVTGALAVAASAGMGAPRPHTEDREMERAEQDRLRNEGAAAERERLAAIEAVASLPIMARIPADKHKALLATARADASYDEARAQREFLAALQAVDDEPPVSSGAGADMPNGGQRADIRAGADAVDKGREGMADAVQFRMGLDREGKIAARLKGSEYMGMSAVEMARRSLELRGKRVRGVNRDQIVSRAFTFRAQDGGIMHTTSDFPAVLENALNKAALLGWEETEETWRQIARIGSIPDFRPAPRSGLGEYPTLPKVPEGGEYKYVTLSDRKETIVLLTYGSAVGITRQAIVNDDLQQFGRIGTKQGRAAARRVGDLVYLVLTENPTMGQDGVALFDAAHNNIATVAGPPRVDTLDNMRVLMALQTDPDNNAHGLNLPLQRVIVPKALETQSNVLRASQYDPDSTSRANSRAPNPFQGTFDVVADPRLDAASSAVWYTSSNPNTYDVIEAGFLEGATEPYLESREGWTVDGLEAKVRIDAAAIPLDFRALARNPGA